MSRPESGQTFSVTSYKSSKESDAVPKSSVNQASLGVDHESSWEGRDAKCKEIEMEGLQNK